MTTRPLAVQTPVVLELTDLAPSLSVVFRTALNPPPELQIGPEGMFVIVGGGDGVALAIVKDCGLPEAAAKSVLCAVCAVNVHWPAVT